LESHPHLLTGSNYSFIKFCCRGKNRCNPRGSVPVLSGLRLTSCQFDALGPSRLNPLPNEAARDSCHCLSSGAEDLRSCKNIWREFLRRMGKGGLIRRCPPSRPLPPGLFDWETRRGCDWWEDLPVKLMIHLRLYSALLGAGTHDRARTVSETPVHFLPVSFKWGQVGGRKLGYETASTPSRLLSLSRRLNARINVLATSEEGKWARKCVHVNTSIKSRLNRCKDDELESTKPLMTGGRFRMAGTMLAI
jgi:hypothetical protein